MSEIVTKWAATVWCDKVQVAKGHFKQTAKMFVREGGRHHDDLNLALGFVDRVTHQSNLLHDTVEQALDALRRREMRKIHNLQVQLNRVQKQIDLIDDFEIPA